MEKVFGKYILRERIGMGGMGEVYRAIKRGPEGFEAEVALKVILPHLAREESFRRRFSREARVAASLRHPNIVQVNGFDIHEGTPFIEMELIEGADLTSLLKSLGKGAPLPIKEALYIIHEAARGLAFAHSCPSRDPTASAGVIHRDFSPHNILISEEGQVKIADFGIARAAMDGTAPSGTLMGKLAYMSPEQIDGRTLDHRSDLFSLGTTAYQLLSGVHPFLRSGEGGTLRAVQEASPEPLSGISPDLPAEITLMIHSLLSRAPENRPASALEVTKALEPFLEPASAKKVGQRIGKIRKQEPQPSQAFTGTAPTIPQKMRKSSIGLIAIPVVILGAVLLFFLAGGLPKNAGRPAVSAAPEFSSPTLETPSVPSRELTYPEVSIPVSTRPSGAGVSSKGSFLGLTPLPVLIPSGQESLEVTLSLEGHEETRVVLSRDMETSGVTVGLEPLPTGTLRIAAIPWARVTFREADLGITPVVIGKTPVGSYRLVLSNDEMGIRREMTVKVEEGQNPVLVVDLATGRVLPGK
ncbi:MAG: serine/threonine protein kinase [Proteobacteria bacterium]|nr:serine/threonine protein kinase [Pseudomonadota bacterium]